MTAASALPTLNQVRQFTSIAMSELIDFYIEQNWPVTGEEVERSFESLELSRKNAVRLYDILSPRANGRQTEDKNLSRFCDLICEFATQNKKSRSSRRAAYCKLLEFVAALAALVEEGRKHHTQTQNEKAAHRKFLKFEAALARVVGAKIGRNSTSRWEETWLKVLDGFRTGELR